MPYKIGFSQCTYCALAAGIAKCSIATTNHRQLLHQHCAYAPWPLTRTLYQYHTIPYHTTLNYTILDPRARASECFCLKWASSQLAENWKTRFSLPQLPKESSHVRVEQVEPVKVHWEKLQALSRVSSRGQVDLASSTGECFENHLLRLCT